MFEMHITNIGPDAVMASIPPAYSVGDLETCQYGGFDHQFGYINWCLECLEQEEYILQFFPNKKAFSNLFRSKIAKLCRWFDIKILIKQLCKMGCKQIEV